MVRTCSARSGRGLDTSVSIKGLAVRGRWERGSSVSSLRLRRRRRRHRRYRTSGSLSDVRHMVRRMVVRLTDGLGIGD